MDGVWKVYDKDGNLKHTANGGKHYFDNEICIDGGCITENILKEEIGIVLRAEIPAPQWQFGTNSSNKKKLCNGGNDFISEEQGIESIPPNGAVGVPMQDWECRYCQYYSICPSTLADKKPRFSINPKFFKEKQ